MMTRRQLLRGAAAMGPVLRAGTEGPAAGWDQAASILKRIRPPVFPQRDFDITRFGASGDGQKNCTADIARAIAACAAAGGGRVVVPAGVFLTGAIHLKSNVNLHVDAGATLLFSTDPKQYLPAVFTRWEGTECMNYSPLMYAFAQTNVAVTGTGTLDGQADEEHWWPWKGHRRIAGVPDQAKARNTLMAMADKDVPVKDRVFGEGGYLRPMFIQPYRCTNVLIQGVTIRRSPMWEVHPVLCRNVTVQDVKISTHGPNNDGCDPESSRDVLIKDCVFDTGDDCIAIKSGRNRDGRRVAAACENLIVTGCTMKDGHGGVTIGSEVSGDVRNVFVENCRMDSPNLDRALRLKTNSYRGGTIENIYFRNVRVGQVADAIVSVDFTYEEGEGGQFPPLVRKIFVEDVTCRQAKYALYLRGYRSDPIRDVRLSRCTFEHVDKPNVIENVEGLKLDAVAVNNRLAT